MEAATNFSGFYITNQTYNFTPEPDYSKLDERDDEMVRFIYIERLVTIISSPIIVVGGTFGNILTFIVMRRGSLREVSTCFYMSILALADTGKLTIEFSLIYFIQFAEFLTIFVSTLKGLNLPILVLMTRMQTCGKQDF